MILQKEFSTQFEKDLKRIIKRGKNTEKLLSVIDKLIKNQPLEAKHRLHKLSGNWTGHWECHIEPDWLLIFYYTENTLVLSRTGTHSDLFKK